MWCFCPRYIALSSFRQYAGWLQATARYQAICFDEQQSNSSTYSQTGFMPKRAQPRLIRAAYVPIFDVKDVMRNS